MGNLAFRISSSHLTLPQRVPGYVGMGEGGVVTLWLRGGTSGWELP